ncbi:hypothetical protein BS47DRAFT_1343735 [Hydnum rufescens UP504]|uniref:Uncharacterized protein n=1 Tax=Hydnum rufescens UP504 TaxID=1448309 RepID=A0A9P6AY88_9AGAM|nr:hypothetical protein BS47DRAFT_1343735 [Hydnum rufescens UP504]
MDSFKNWDLQRTYTYITDAPDFVYEYLPSSFGLDSKTRSDWETYNDRQKVVLPDFRVDVLDIYDTAGPVIAHIVGRATSLTGAKFEMEYMMLIHIRSEYNAHTGRALKIHRVEEWIDSKYAASFFGNEKKRLDARKRARAAAASRAAARPTSIELRNGSTLEMRAAKL